MIPNWVGLLVYLVLGLAAIFLLGIKWWVVALIVIFSEIVTLIVFELTTKLARWYYSRNP